MVPHSWHSQCLHPHSTDEATEASGIAPLSWDSIFLSGQQGKDNILSAHSRAVEKVDVYIKPYKPYKISIFSPRCGDSHL